MIIDEMEDLYKLTEEEQIARCKSIKLNRKKNIPTEEELKVQCEEMKDMNQDEKRAYLKAWKVARKLGYSHLLK